MNIVIMKGRLTSKPEIRVSQSGEYRVTSFSIAINEGKNPDGTIGTTFVNCEAWNDKADFICQYFDKGQGISIQGKYKKTAKEDKEFHTIQVFQAFFELNDPKL